MDLTGYLKSHGDDAPSGENLEYDPLFTALELVAQPGEERQVGDSIIQAEEPDYKEVVSHALAVMEKSHDLRAASHLALARLRLDGLPGFAEVTEYMRGCLTEYWDTCHPQLDADDDNDPTMRVNTLRTLADAGTVMRALRLAPLTDSRSFGRFGLRDIAVAEGEMPAPAGMDKVPDLASISAAFQDTAPDTLAGLLAAARAAHDNLKAIDAVFDDKVPGQGPDLEAPLKLMKQIVGRLVAATGGEAAADEPTGADPASGPAAQGGPQMSGGPAGSINSRVDVIAALDRIVGYYQRYEPSSPLPLLILRAKRLVGADFLTIMKDMAPSGVENVNLIGGIEEE